MKKATFCAAILLATIFGPFSHSAFATLKTESYSGVIDYLFEASGESNPFGLSIGDTTYVTVTYDDSLVSQSGTSTVSFGYFDGQELRIKLGSQTFSEGDDVDYGGGYPQLSFIDGSLTGIIFSHPYHDLGSGRGVSMYGDNLTAKDGRWDDYSWSLVIFWEVGAIYDFSSPVVSKCNGQVVTIAGTYGHDTIYGTDGIDVIHGLGGHDVIFGKNGDDVICGGEGNDTIFAGVGNDILIGGDGNDSLYGAADDDELDGGLGHDVLYGRDGDDILDGGQGWGNDTLKGGDGYDQCYDLHENTFNRDCEEFNGQSGGNLPE